MLCPQAMMDNLADLDADDMPQYDSSEDDSQNGMAFPSLEEEPEIISVWGDQYLNAEILILRGDNKVRGKLLH